MEHEPANRRLMLWSIVAGLAAWGVLLGLGAYLGLDPETPDRDVRRLAFVGGAVAVFLAFWMILLWLRRRR